MIEEKFNHICDGMVFVIKKIIAAMLLAMRYIVWCEPKRLFSFTLEAESLKALSSVTEAYLMTQLEHSFYTLDFYKSLLQYGETI